MSAVLPLNITQDSLPEEAEAFLLKLIQGSVQGGAEVDEPMEVSASFFFFFSKCIRITAAAQL